MAEWFVYIVRCSDGSLYTGITNDLKKRLAKHNSGGGARYTRSRRPVRLAWKRRVNSESRARKLESKIKLLKRVEKLDIVKNRTRRI